jgi:hypothetical protein
LQLTYERLLNWHLVALCKKLRQLQRGDERAMQPEHLARIRSICEALVAAGFDSLDKQADVLNLPRSTTWNVLHANHKKSGLSAGLLGRTLKSPRLPPSVRAKIIEYIEAKAAGELGHNKIQQRRFRARLKTAYRCVPPAK